MTWKIGSVGGLMNNSRELAATIVGCRHRWCRWVPVLHGAWAERASTDRDGARRLLAQAHELPEHGPEGGGSRQRRLEPVERHVRRTRETPDAVSERPDVPVRRSYTCQVN